MTGMDMTTFTKGWAKAAKEMVSQSKSWAVTSRDLVMGPWQGMMSSNETMAAAARPWFDMTTEAHDRWLQMWESQAHAAIDVTLEMAQNVGKVE